MYPTFFCPKGNSFALIIFKDIFNYSTSIKKLNLFSRNEFKTLIL